MKGSLQFLLTSNDGVLQGIFSLFSRPPVSDDNDKDGALESCFCVGHAVDKRLENFAVQTCSDLGAAIRSEAHLSLESVALEVIPTA